MASVFFEYRQKKARFAQIKGGWRPIESKRVASDMPPFEFSAVRSIPYAFDDRTPNEFAAIYTSRRLTLELVQKDWAFQL